MNVATTDKEISTILLLSLQPLFGKYGCRQTDYMMFPSSKISLRRRLTLLHPKIMATNNFPMPLISISFSTNCCFLGSCWICQLVFKLLKYICRLLKCIASFRYLEIQGSVQSPRLDILVEVKEQRARFAECNQHTVCSCLVVNPARLGKHKFCHV